MMMNKCVEQQKIVRELVDRARAAGEDQRTVQRYPFFQPVSITAEHDGTVSLSAFSRDISESGIGLLLYFPVRLRFVHLKLHLADDEEVSLTGYVRWCQPCGHGWYAAGVDFKDGQSDEIGFESGLPVV
jgi:hypothetical protein